MVLRRWLVCHIDHNKWRLYNVLENSFDGRYNCGAQTEIAKARELIDDHDLENALRS